MTQTTDAALVTEDVRALRVQNGALRTLNRYLEQEIEQHRAKAQEYHAATMTIDSEREANRILTDTIEAQARRIEALEGAGADKWWLRDSDVSRMARSIMHRLGHEPSMKELWARLEQAEADRDRMMNALQEVQSRATNGKVTMDPHTRTIINRALSRIKPYRPEVTP